MSHLSRRRGRGLDNKSKNVLFALVVFLVIPISLLNGALIGLGLPRESFVTAGIAIFIYLIVVGVLVWVWVRLVVIPKRKAEEERKQHLQQRVAEQEEERRREARKREEQEEERRRRAQQQAEERRRKQEREERERAEQIEALLQRDTFRDSVNYMSGTEFEDFMADVFKRQGYGVETTPKSGDQGVDLLLTIEDRKVAVQLKRYAVKPIGNDAVGAVFAGMFHYKAKEAWVITTSSFTKKAVQLAKSVFCKAEG